MRNGGGERGGFAGAGRPDNEHDVGVPRHRTRRPGLGCIHGAGRLVEGVGVVEPVEQQAPVHPPDQRLFLIQDRLRGQGPIQHRLSDRTTILAHPHILRDRFRQLHTPCRHDLVGEVVEQFDNLCGGDGGVSRDQGAEFTM